MTVISTGEAAEWNVFAHRTQDGRPIVVRSRLGKREVRQFAERNSVVRLRCAFTPDLVNEVGMPLSTDELDDWEDRLMAELGPDTETHQIAAVTGAGVRDFFFTAETDDELFRAVGDVTGTYPFDLQVARVEGPKAELLNSLTPPE